MCVTGSRLALEGVARALEVIGESWHLVLSQHRALIAGTSQVSHEVPEGEE